MSSVRLRAQSTFGLGIAAIIASMGLCGVAFWWAAKTSSEAEARAQDAVTQAQDAAHRDVARERATHEAALAVQRQEHNLVEQQLRAQAQRAEIDCILELQEVARAARDPATRDALMAKQSDDLIDHLKRIRLELMDKEEAIRTARVELTQLRSTLADREDQLDRTTRQLTEVTLERDRLEAHSTRQTEEMERDRARAVEFTWQAVALKAEEAVCAGYATRVQERCRGEVSAKFYATRQTWTHCHVQNGQLFTARQQEGPDELSPRAVRLWDYRGDTWWLDLCDPTLRDRSQLDAATAY
jgi:hypothetical protein